MPRKKHWSRIIEESGIQIRIYERPHSSKLSYSIVRWRPAR